jgi:hypothetical protein
LRESQAAFHIHIAPEIIDLRETAASAWDILAEALTVSSRPARPPLDLLDLLDLMEGVPRRRTGPDVLVER